MGVTSRFNGLHLTDRVPEELWMEVCYIVGEAVIKIIPKKKKYKKAKWLSEEALQIAVKRREANGDCSHEIKKHLLLGRKAMTNLVNVLKSRGITLPTKVHIVKAVDFLVVIHGCESWIIKKAERLEELILSNCGVR